MELSADKRAWLVEQLQKRGFGGDAVEAMPSAQLHASYEKVLRKEKKIVSKGELEDAVGKLPARKEAWEHVERLVVEMAELQRQNATRDVEFRNLQARNLERDAEVNQLALDLGKTRTALAATEADLQRYKAAVAPMADGILAIADTLDQTSGTLAQASAALKQTAASMTRDM